MSWNTPRIEQASNVGSMGNDHSGSGTGSKLTSATVIVCGVASLIASLLSFLWVLLSVLVLVLTPLHEHRSIWLQRLSLKLTSQLLLLTIQQQELSKATAAALCHPNPPYGSHILGFIFCQSYVPDRSLLHRPLTRYL